ncbi:GSCFA domain-containing protein [Tenacibaculum sp. SG-28]|uniref:GSCFA domain-containing protein n=1 Tax=Tenacibaculum sp. SG-28 TaxID=754426 RepID=UPI000CF525A0|nr:GSCFA domain-containing protein [Tenacibaculum sp. SG-28]PQJ21523.1 GSCFA domain-containing protein [Tenacibaculum sp. SG-28]
MNLRTHIPLRPARKQISYSEKIVLFGSCFSENIGDKLTYFQFQAIQNPFGILFHPKAIENLVQQSIEKRTYTEKEVFFLNERWHCFAAHSSLSNPEKEVHVKRLNTTLEQTRKTIKSADVVVITLGTAWVYRNIETKAIVANCHKVPQKMFTKELLSVEEIRQSLQNIYTLCKGLNSSTRFILTVSPIRHIKDGFIENQQSKSHLINAVHQFIKNKRDASYFPSFEIMMDELRDYRFYKEDMIHPNTTAINYIWEKFSEVWIDTDAQKTMETVAAIQKGLAHKPFNPASEKHQLFLKKLAQKKETLQQAFPHMLF